MFWFIQPGSTGEIKLLQHRALSFCSTLVCSSKVTDQTARGMSSEEWITCPWGQDCYDLLITNYLVALSLWHCLVEIILHIHPLEAFSQRYRHFLGVRIWLHEGSYKVSADLENHVAAVQHHTAPKLWYRVNICFRGPAGTLLWRPAVLWLEHFAFSHHSLARFLSILLLPTYYCQSHALRCLQLGPARLCEIRQPVFSVQWSHLSTRSSQPSFTGNWNI